ncbi:MAG: 8-amino-7-oxononanoate synthase [Candidatus Omnitrophota bacterium]
MKSVPLEDISEELAGLKAQNLLRSLKIVDGPQESHISLGGRRLVNLSSNNYLGLSNDKRLKNAAISAIKKYGLGAGASRLICGNMLLHKKLEDRIAAFKKTEAALLFNSGYCANLAVLSSLCGRDDVVFSDKLNHASIIDAIILSRAEFRRYPHKDIKNLESLLKNSNGFRRRLIVTDSVFSMDGDLAPLPELTYLAKKYNCLLYIDEAHATGILGKTGKGALEYFGIEDEAIIQMGTLSKAVGAFGAYVCGAKILIDYLINKARPFIYTTALPVSVCAGAIAALDIIESDGLLRSGLSENIKFFRQALRSLGFKNSLDPTPVIPLLIGDAVKTMEFSRRLFSKGVFVQGIRPPTVPAGTSRLRITLMATHKKKDLEFALDKIAEIGRQLGII